MQGQGAAPTEQGAAPTEQGAGSLKFSSSHGAGPGTDPSGSRYTEQIHGTGQRSWSIAAPTEQGAAPTVHGAGPGADPSESRYSDPRSRSAEPIDGAAYKTVCLRNIGFSTYKVGDYSQELV